VLTGRGSDTLLSSAPLKKGVVRMRKSVLLLASTAIALLLASGVALAEEKLDQQTVRPPHPAYYYEFDSNYQHLAQVFTAGKSGYLSKVSVRIEKSVCGAGASTLLYKDINVQIYSVDPNGYGGWASSRSTTLPASQVPYQTECTHLWTAPPWTDVTFAPGNRTYVIAGRQYVIALVPEPVPADVGSVPSYRWYHDGDTYLGGTGYRRWIDWVSDDWSRLALDFFFRTYVDVPDTDGDGLTNDVDQCDYDPGPASNNGCPVPPDTVSPTGSVEINGGARITNSRTVRLALQATDPSPGTGVVSMRLKNAGGDWTAWQPYAKRKDWRLARGEGKKSIYAQYKDGAGNVSGTASDTIIYRP